MTNTVKLVPESVAKHLPGLTALTSPNFIVEKDGELYLAVAVLKYSEREADAERDPALKEQKKQGVAKVRRMFEEGLKASNLDCSEVKFAASASSILESGEGEPPPGMNTEPPGMNTSP
jgi:hypothetical protein